MRHAFVLAGGLGTRLRPYTSVLPKPLIPLGNEAILERVLRNIAAAGIDEATVSLGYLGHLIEAVIGEGDRFGLRVHYTREDQPLGTAGALSLIPHPLADDDLLLVINGDTLTTLDFGALLDWFEPRSSAAAAMVCVQRDVVIDYGVVEADDSGHLMAIREKPRMHYTLSTGINVLRGHVLRRIGTGRVDMPDLLVSLVADGQTVECRVVDDLWMDLGRAEDLQAANELVDRGRL